MQICLFGIYNPQYSRNYVLKSGFLKHGYTVVECRVDPTHHTGLSKYWLLYKEYRKIRKEQFDHIIVCFPGHITVFLARLLFGNKIIFDVFVSLYDSNVLDRRTYSTWNPYAWRDWLLDWSSCRMARTLLFDTNEHIHYFSKTFRIPTYKCIRVFIGTQDDIFYPRPNPNNEVFTVNFHGSFIPLHGVSYIITAAQLLKDENIVFQLIGEGPETKISETKVNQLGLQKKILFFGRVSLEQLAEHITRADISLGIFGNTPKASRVIPNKIYEAMAMQKAIITADTPAIRELLNEQDAVLIPPANPSALAEAILELKHQQTKRTQLALAARTFFSETLLPEHIIGRLLQDLARR